MKKFAEKINYKVPDVLQQYIFATIQGESKSKANFTFPVHPTGFPIIICVYNTIPVLNIDGVKTQPKKRLHLAGQIHNANCILEVNGIFGQLGFILHPTAPYYLFHKKGAYFLNLWKDFGDASPIEVNTLLTEIDNNKKITDKLDLITNFLKELHNNRLPAIEWLDNSLIEIFKNNGSINQEELTEKSGISLRHFRRKFKEIIGVSPKYYCKVIQLNTVFELLNLGDNKKIHLLALDCGYYDQSHFVNDFKKLIGNSPTNFLNGKHAFVKEYLGQKTSKI